MAGAAEARPSLPGLVFCGTSYFYACADTDDMHHRGALALAGEAAGRWTQLWTTWDVISETVTLLRHRHSSAAALGFLDDVKRGLRVREGYSSGAHQPGRSSPSSPHIQPKS
jgi:hypothetical protein